MRTFHKFSGAGNTFFIFDDRSKDFPIQSIPDLCKDVVDGIILWRRSSESDAEMIYYNADGSLAKMCGNGLRCFIHFLHDQGLVKPMYTIEVQGKLLKVKGNPPTIWTHLGAATVLHWEIVVENHTVYSVDTGVPHAVVFAQDLVDVVKEGMALRHASVFAPDGVNVNFVWVDSRNHLRVRTYERGVERETLACGTGIAASAFVASRLGLVDEKVEVITLSGESLQVDLKGGIQLLGPSEKIAEGQLMI